MAALLVFVFAPASAAATPLPTVTSGNSSWSYGILVSLKVGPNTAGNGWVYEGNATLGYTVTIYENSTSPTTFELTIYRTMGLAFMIRFCDLSCGSPVQWANETFRAYETTATFANFTDQGTVLLNGTTEVPAIALQNSTSFLHANVTEFTDVFLPSVGDRGPHIGFLGANLLARAAVTFTPALGLIPDQLVPGSTWNSSSQFSATGGASWSYYYALHRPVGPVIIGPVSGGLSLWANGTVSVQGAYPTGSVFPYGGSTYPAIVLTVAGPFDVREGIIFIPTPTDIFGSTAQPWDGNATGSASVVDPQSSTLDLKLSSGAEPRIVASSWKYSTAAANAATSPSSAVSPGSPGISSAISSGNPVASGIVQGAPESSDQAQGAQNCLTKGSDCTTLPGPRSFLGLIVVSAAVATVAVLVALAVVSRRRRSPPPVYPNAVLYPPGAAYPAAPAGGPVAPTSPPPPEEDPLDHLW
jgi:hypothetical protein